MSPSVGYLPCHHLHVKDPAENYKLLASFLSHSESDQDLNQARLSFAAKLLFVALRFHLEVHLSLFNCR